MSRRLVWIGVLSVVTLSAAAVAQAQPSPLRGLTSVHVIAEETDDNDAKCGVRKADIEAAAAKVLEEAGVKVADASRTTLNVSVITLIVDPEGVCVSHVGMSLRSLAFGSLSYAPDAKLTVEALLHQERSLFSSDKAEHGARFRERVQALAGRFAKEIARANQ